MPKLYDKSTFAKEIKLMQLRGIVNFASDLLPKKLKKSNGLRYS
jgi:hypothetical protein